MFVVVGHEDGRGRWADVGKKYGEGKRGQGKTDEFIWVDCDDRDGA